MKPITTIIIAALIGIISAYITVQTISPHTAQTQKAEKKETVYERVMRTGTIRCGYTPWPPYLSQDPNTGELSGFYYDLINDVFDLADIKVEWIENQLGMSKQEMEAGKYDSVCGDGPWYATTVKHIAYTNAITYTPVYAYRKKGNSDISEIQSLNNENITFVGIDGDLSVDLAQRFFEKAKINTLVNITDPAQLFVNVATGKADVVIADPVAAKLYDDNNPHMVERISDKPLAVYKGGFSTLKGEHDMIETLNNLIDVAITSGIIDKALDKYDPERKYLLRAKPYTE